MLTHVHYCKYCDCTFDCTKPACNELSGWVRSRKGRVHELKNHACGERQDFMRALRFRLGEECKYRCNKPCSHPPAYKREFENDVQFPYMRPRLEQAEPKLDEDGNSYRNHYTFVPGTRRHAEECVCLKCQAAYRKEVQDHA